MIIIKEQVGLEAMFVTVLHERQAIRNLDQAGCGKIPEPQVTRAKQQTIVGCIRKYRSWSDPS
jgi:hypothetical protein